MAVTFLVVFNIVYFSWNAIRNSRETDSTTISPSQSITDESTIAPTQLITDPISTGASTTTISHTNFPTELITDSTIAPTQLITDPISTGASTTTISHMHEPEGPATFIPLGGDLNGDVGESYLGTSVSLSGNGTAVAIGGVHFAAYRLMEGMAWTTLGRAMPGIDDGDECCLSVSMSANGTIAAIGSPRSDRNGTNAGLVSVYRLEGDGSSWKLLGEPILGLNGTGVPYEEDGGELFGWSVSLSADGTTLAVGAPLLENVEFDRLGQVRVYRIAFSGGPRWQQMGQMLDDGNESEYSEFGRSVSLSRDGLSLAVGAPEFDSPYDHTGRVFAFRYEESIGRWERLGKPILGEDRLDRSGYAVAFSRDGKTLAIGAPGNTPAEEKDTFEGPGHVRVFRMFGGDWAQVGQDIDGTFTSGVMGSSVSLSEDGDIVAAGSPGNGTGCAKVYSLNEDGAWAQIGEDIFGEYQGDRFGTSVSLSNNGSILAVGAPYNQEGRDGPNGHVRIYKLSHST